MSTLAQVGRLFFVVFILALGGRVIWLKRTGRWKHPRSFPVAMVLLSIALVLVSLGQVLSYLGQSPEGGWVAYCLRFAYLQLLPDSQDAPRDARNGIQADRSRVGNRRVPAVE